MKNEEVDRVLRITSEPFRVAWEARRNAGQSLLELKKVRETAVALEERYRKKCTFWSRTMLACILLMPFALWYFKFPIMGKGALLNLIILCPILTIGMVFIVMSEKRFKQIDEILRVDTIFEQFALSISALNPLGTGNSYHDVIDDSFVKDIASSLAIRVVDAQTTFDALRRNPEASRYVVVHAGQWIEKCETNFEKFESNLNKDFGRSLDKPSIFKYAEAYLAKAKPGA